MPNYRCTIDDDNEKRIADISFSIDSGKTNIATMNDQVATQMMDEFLKIIATNNFIQPRDCNVNLYREEWVNGI